MPEHSQQTCLEDLGHRTEGAACGERSLGDLQRGRILHETRGLGLVAQSFRGHAHVRCLLKVGPSRHGEAAAQDRLGQPQVCHGGQQLDARLTLAAVLLGQGGFGRLHDTGIVSGHQQPLHLGDPGDGVLVQVPGAGEEEIERLAGPLRDELQSLPRRLGLSSLDEIDGGAADVLARHLAQAQAGKRPRLLHGPRPDLETAPPPATAARGGRSLPSRPVRFGCARDLGHRASLTQAV